MVSWYVPGLISVRGAEVAGVREPRLARLADSPEYKQIQEGFGSDNGGDDGATMAVIIPQTLIKQCVS